MIRRRLADPGDSGKHSEAEWIARIRDGQRAAFEALVRHYADSLCGFVYNIVGDKDATQELVQDLFLWIWRNRQQWEIRGALTTYLYRSARNRALSHVRHSRLEQRWLEQAARQAPSSTDPRNAEYGSEEEDLRLALARALQSLPDRCRQVFVLSRAHGLSYSEIAETLEISVKTVEIHMSRALAILRTQLNDWLP